MPTPPSDRSSAERLSAQQSAGRFTMSPRRAAAVSALLACLVCMPSLRGGFILDDNYLVANNPTLRSLANIPGFFFHAWGSGEGGASRAGVNAAYYRPLTSTLQAVEYALFGRTPLGWHLTSLLLHMAATALGTLLAARILRNLAGALVAGLIFAVHPVHTETMAAICYQTTLLAGVLTTLALLAFGRILDRDQAGRRTGVFAGLITFLACTAKEEAMVIPLLALAWLFLQQSPDRRRVLLRGWGALVAGAAAALAIRTAIVTTSSVTFFENLGRATVALTMVRVMALYAELLLVPLRLCYFYDWFIIPPATSLSVEVVSGALLIVAVLVAIVLTARRAPGIAIGLTWIPLGLVPVMHFVPILNVAGERFLYLPSLGFSLAAGGVFMLALKRARRSAVLGAALVVVAFAGRTLLRWPDWRDDRSLNQATAAAFPETPIPWVTLYRLELVEGDRASALRALEEACRRAPDWPVVQHLMEASRAQTDPRLPIPNPAREGRAAEGPR